MSAPNYQPSNDDTIVPPSSKGQHQHLGVSPSGSGSGHDEDLHRYVTEDQPRHAKMAMGGEGGGIGPAQGAVKGKGAGEGIIIVQPLRKNEMQPSYAQDLGSNTVEHGFYGSMMNALGACIGTCGMIPCCPLPNPFKEVNQGSVGLVSRFGQFYKSVDPGLVQVNVCSEQIKIVDVKIQLTSVPRQTVQTKDNVSVEVDSVICWHVVSPYRAAFGINDVRLALVERAQTTLRQVVGGRVLQAVISDREGLAQEVAPITNSDRYEGSVDFWCDVYGINMSALVPLAKKITSEEPSIETIGGENVLSWPFVVKHIDCYTFTVEEFKTITTKYRVSSMMLAPIHGFGFWFEVEFNGPAESSHNFPSNLNPLDIIQKKRRRGSDTVLLSTAPEDEPTHWQQTILYFPDPVEVKQDQIIEGSVTVSQSEENPRFLNIHLECSTGGQTLVKDCAMR